MSQLTKIEITKWEKRAEVLITFAFSLLGYLLSKCPPRDAQLRNEIVETASTVLISNSNEPPPTGAGPMIEAEATAGGGI